MELMMMDSKSLLTTAVIGCLLVAVNATVDLSCQVRRTVSQPVSGGQCPDNSALRLCTSEEIMCSCLGQGIILEWMHSLFTANIIYVNSGGTVFPSRVDSATGATAVVTAVNQFVNITSDLTLNVTTTATVNASQFNNTAIRCQDASGPAGGMEQMIFVLAPPPAPTITTISFTAGGSFTIGWIETFGSCALVNRYDPLVSPNDFNCTTRGMTYTCSYNEIHLGQTYTFTVSALNCGTQRGEEASVTVNLQAPSQPILTATPLYDSSGRLLEIESWSVEGPRVFIAAGVDSSPTEYIFTYDSGSEFLQFTEPCTGNSCQHTFRITNTSQVQQYTVSVAVRNVVGVGTASTPVTIDSMNNVFNVNVNIEVPEVICQFLNGPVASATCTIVYGTDPLNLPNNDTSTGTNVTKVTIPLGVSLHRDTLYYYVVSTIGVQMQGTFRIACIPEDLGGRVDTTPDSSCPSSVGSIQIENGVGCYSGLETGSEVTYSCSCGFALLGNERRVCQSDGFWSGTIPQCVTDCSQIPPPPSVNGGVLARNDCLLLEYDCPSSMSVTLQYDCDTQIWSTDSTCSGAATTVAVIVVPVIVVVILVAILIIVVTIICIKLKNKVRKTNEKPGPVYAEVQPVTDDALPEMKRNVAYGPIEPHVTDQFEMGDNLAYGSRTVGY